MNAKPLFTRCAALGAVARRPALLCWAVSAVASAAFVLLLAGCGGGDVETPAPLWGDDGSATATPRADWPAEAAARWSGQRYATRAQLESELLLVAPYSLVIDADDQAELERGLRRAQEVQAFSGGQPLLGVFARSREPALAARLAERLAQEQGWENVFVVH